MLQTVKVTWHTGWSLITQRSCCGLHLDPVLGDRLHQYTVTLSKAQIPPANFPASERVRSVGTRSLFTTTTKERERENLTNFVTMSSHSKGYWGKRLPCDRVGLLTAKFELEYFEAQTKTFKSKGWFTLGS